MNRDDFDAATQAEAYRRPGMDTRQWVSYALVSPSQDVGGETIDSVEFDDELGPLVNVKLQPSNIEVRCRVAQRFAGAGEGEYSPFIEGDEVIVLIPEGDERAAPVIVGRLNNSIDVFPAESVAGQDPTNNTFAFERRRTPFVTEYASSYMLRVASHGGFLLISDNGTITIRDGSKGALQMGPDLFGYMEGVPGEVDPAATPSPGMLLQLDLTGRRLSIQVDDATLQMNGSDSDNNAGNTILAAPAEFQVVLGTNQAVETVLSVEAFLAMLDKFATSLAAPAAGPAAFTALLGDVALGGSTLLTPAAVALGAGKQLAAQSPKPAADPATGVQLRPGLGAVLFKTG